jgi:hypothetical protein
MVYRIRIPKTTETNYYCSFRCLDTFEKKGKKKQTSTYPIVATRKVDENDKFCWRVSTFYTFELRERKRERRKRYKKKNILFDHWSKQHHPMEN